MKKDAPFARDEVTEEETTSWASRELGIRPQPADPPRDDGEEPPAGDAEERPAGDGKEIDRDPAALLGRGRELEISGRWDEALPCLMEAAKGFQLARDVEGQSEALRLIGNIENSRSNWHEAMQAYLEGMDLCRRFGHDRGLAYHLNCIGTLHFEQGNWQLAIDFTRRALDLAKNSGESNLVSMCENNLGMIANIRGRWDEAIAHYKKSLKYLQKAHDPRGAAHVFHNMALTYADRGDDSKAEACYRKSLQLAMKINHKALIANVYLNKSNLYIKREDYDGASVSLREALTIFEGLDDNLGIAECMRVFGMIHRERNQSELAEKYFDRALRMFRGVNVVLGEAETLRELALLQYRHRDGKKCLENLSTALALFKDLEAEKSVQDIDRKLVDLESLFMNIVQELGAGVESTDTYTFGHSRRVALLASALLDRLKVSKEQRQGILVAAFLHDLGKLDLDIEILRKPGALTAEEYKQVQLHPIYGEQRLASIRFPWEVLPSIRHHHERWDGEGYPDRIAGDRIPFGARVIALPDVFDALTTDRPYRKAMTFPEAVNILLSEAGGAFDPELTRIFVEELQELFLSKWQNSELFDPKWVEERIQADY